MTKKIGIFRMNSGEEVVSEYKINDDVEYPYVLIKPQILVPVSESSGGVTIAIMPWLLSNPNGSINVKSGAIQGKVEDVPDRLEAQYLQRTSSIDLTSSMPPGVKNPMFSG